MSRRKKEPLRVLTADERQELIRFARSQATPAAEVTRARILLAVARGDDYQAAARAAGRRSGDAASHLVARFNVEGLAALEPRHGGGRRPTYGPEARKRIAAEAARVPTSEAGRDRELVALDPPPVAPHGARRPAPGLGLYHPAGAPGVRGQLPAHPHLVPDRLRRAAPQGRPGDGHGPGCRGEKKLIEHAYRTGEAMGLAVWCTDQAGPYQTIPYAGQSWRPEGRPARLPHEYLRDGTAKVLTLFRPADGHVHLHGRDGLPQRGPPSLAQAGAGRHPRRDARPAGRAHRRVASGLGAVAGGPLDQADAAGRAAAAADAAGAGQPGRAQDAGAGLLAVRATGSCHCTRRWAARG